MEINKEIDGLKIHIPDIGKYVCEDCLSDEAIKEFINRKNTKKKCDYCRLHRDELKYCAPVEEVYDLIIEGILFEWEPKLHNIRDSNLKESSENIITAPIIDSKKLIRSNLPKNLFKVEILYKEFIPILVNINDGWHRKDITTYPDEWENRINWEVFKVQIKHNSRFFFSEIDIELEEDILDRER